VREGVYVRRIAKRGVDTVAEAVALAYMVLRDLRRGYTYDPRRNCRRIRMTRALARRRLKFIVMLAQVHGAGDSEVRAIRRMVSSILRAWRMPSRVAGRSTREIVRRMVVRVA